MLLLLVVGVLLPALWLGEAIARARRETLLHALGCIPVTPIRDVVDGACVRIEGEVVLDGPPLCAPLSGRRCAAYRAAIEYYAGAGRRVVREERADRLLVRDRFGGQARVRVPARWLIAPEATLRLGASFIAPSRRVCRFLRRHGFAPCPSLDGAPYADRLSEAALRPHDRVTIVGVAHWEPAPSPDGAAPATGYRTAPSLVVVADGGQDRPVYLIKTVALAGVTSA